MPNSVTDSMAAAASTAARLVRLESAWSTTPRTALERPEDRRTDQCSWDPVGGSVADIMGSHRHRNLEPVHWFGVRYGVSRSQIRGVPNLRFAGPGLFYVLRHHNGE